MRHIHRWTQFGDRNLWQCHCGKTKKSAPIDYREVAKRRKVAVDARRHRDGEVGCGKCLSCRMGYAWWLCERQDQRAGS